MILSDKTIHEYIQAGKIRIFPDFHEADIRPAGIRLHLGSDLLIPHDNQTIDFAYGEDLLFDKVNILEEPYTLQPGEFLLGSTHERFQVPRNIVCHVDGRSTVARVGLAIHCTSGIIDGNFEEARSVVLEIKNQGPFAIVLRHKIPLAMLSFTLLTTDIHQKTQTMYQGQEGVMPPNLKMQLK